MKVYFEDDDPRHVYAPKQPQITFLSRELLPLELNDHRLLLTAYKRIFTRIFFICKDIFEKKSP